MGVKCLNLMQFFVILLVLFYKYTLWVQNVKFKSVFDFFFFFVYNDAYLNKVTKYSPVPGKTFFVLKLLLL